jgi:hypothetical protein
VIRWPSGNRKEMPQSGIEPETTGFSVLHLNHCTKYACQRRNGQRRVGKGETTPPSSLNSWMAQWAIASVCWRGGHGFEPKPSPFSARHLTTRPNNQVPISKRHPQPAARQRRDIPITRRWWLSGLLCRFAGVAAAGSSPAVEIFSLARRVSKCHWQRGSSNAIGKKSRSSNAIGNRGRQMPLVAGSSNAISAKVGRIMPGCREKAKVVNDCFLFFIFCFIVNKP